ncbi:hypothetical protein SAMN05216259_106407 [Actinacidiphila guanduensis]|uniref:Uncharacterized protein n=1 Tax=Actinacidiphila guanduensis TaxID=310781 RepID=A0A1H0FS79_9ACTN|nr:hypothetical protein SAMN05216259_106407 [Actinacidiphila guanduensis]
MRVAAIYPLAGLAFIAATAVVTLRPRVTAPAETSTVTP